MTAAEEQLVAELAEAQKHHPELLTAGRRGAWCNCSCGWRSETYHGVTGAHLAFGEHLAAVARADAVEAGGGR